MSVSECFRMPRPVSITGRSSSITNAFVNGIIPCHEPTDAEIEEALGILGLSANDLRCSYCGDVATEWDHLRPIVRKQRPTGYITEIANLVPACGKCNQSKSGADWRSWISGKAPRSPATRGIRDISGRIARLEAYEKWRPPTVFDFERVVGKELWSMHWKNWKQLMDLMQECEQVALRIREVIESAVEQTHAERKDT